MRDTIIDYLKNEASTRNGFGARAYSKFIKQLESYNGSINNTVDLESVPDLSRGKIYDKCCELLNGNIVFKKDNLSIFKEELQQITAIGPAKVKELVSLGITSMSELNNRKDELLNDKQLLGLKYHQFDNLRIPRDEINRHRDFIEFIVGKLPNTDFKIVGSYRRGHQDSGDIDILITNSENNKSVFKEFITYLKQGDYLIDDLAYGNVKYMGYSAFCGIPRRIDILYCSPEEYPFSMLYFTGSGEFNKGMRKWCLTQNYTLNEHGLYHFKDKKKGKCVNYQFNEESDIFKYLNLEYTEPPKRVKFNH